MRLTSPCRLSSFGVSMLATLAGNGMAWSAEPTPGMTDGWHFTVGQPLAYTYECTQTVAWSSAGDELSYTTDLRYRFVLKATQVDEQHATLTATILAVQASQQGPGSQRRVDSTQPSGERGREDPLLGHLLELENAVFTIVCDPRTGAVSEVRGGDEVAARIAKHAPSAFPGERSPLLTQAEAAYSSAHLSQLWSQVLAAPRTGTVPVPLGPPMDLTIDQVWTGNHWTCALPTRAKPTTVSFTTAPSPVTATLGDLSGSGSVTAAASPQATNGELHYTLHFAALTQPVDQHHTLVWRLRRLTALPASP